VLDEDERGDRGDTPPQSTGDPRSILIPLPRVMPARAFETGVDRPLRLRTYLAPGLPLELFALVRARLERDLACPVVLESETQRSAPDPDGPDPFASTRAVGSHAAALAAVESGTADCAAIDSNTLLLEERAGTHRALRVIESFGPYPTQPIVLRADLPPQVKRTITTSLLTLHQDDEGRRALAACAVRRLAPVTEAHYAAERTLLGLALGAAPCAPSDLR